jgi:Ca2+-binding EF-hand superfamily protein
MISSISNVGSYITQMITQTRQQRRDDLFAKVDSNGDSKIDKTEFSEFATKLSENTGNTLSVDDVFSTYDADGDGALSKDEMEAFMKDNAPPPPNGMCRGMGKINMQAMLQQHLDDLFGKIDSNGDSGIDKTEFSSFAEKISECTGTSLNVDDVFSTYDANGDGTLTTDEMKAFMKDNAPPPPQMQNAMSAYGTYNSIDQISQLIDLLKNQSVTDS